MTKLRESYIHICNKCGASKIAHVGSALLCHVSDPGLRMTPTALKKAEVLWALSVPPSP